MLDQGAVSLLCLPEHRVLPLALGDVAHYGAHHLFAAVGDPDGSDLDVHEGSVLAPVAPLADDVALLGEDAPDVGVYALPVVRDEIVDLHPEELVGGVAEQPLERGVTVQDPRRHGVEQEDSLGGLLDHGAVALLALLERLLVPLAARDVAQHQEASREPSPTIPQRRERQLVAPPPWPLAELHLLVGLLRYAVALDEGI